jgi:hypothetical protein
MLCANADGSHKLPPLVIGKSLNPRCLKNIDRALLGVDYHANKTAWMTSNIFFDWVKQLDRVAAVQGRTIAIILDNASSHHKLDPAELPNIELIFLVANTTRICQPLDQGTLYCKRVLCKLVDVFENSDAIPFDVNLKEAIDWLTLSWGDVKRETRNHWLLFSKGQYYTIQSGNPKFPKVTLLRQMVAADMIMKQEYHKVFHFGWEANLAQWFDFDRFHATEGD